MVKVFVASGDCDGRSDCEGEEDQKGGDEQEHIRVQAQQRKGQQIGKRKKEKKI